MSGDVQPRKRNKDKRFKKKESNLSDIHLPQKSVKKDDDLDFDETNIHVQKDIKFGGNIISKVFFSLVFGALICMVGIIVLEHRGTGNEVQSSSDSPWSQMLEGWIEDKPDAHDDVAHDESYHHKEKEDDRGIKDKSESWERDAEDSKEDKEEDDGDDGPDDLDDDLTEPDEESDKADDEETPEEEEGAGKPVLAPSAPLPPTSQEPHPVYVEEISSPLPPVEEEPPPPLDRRATLVEPGEVSLPSDVEESDFGEYEEEEEEESQQSDVEPTRESTLVTYEYSPVDTEQEEEEEEEKSDNDSAPINDKWAGISRSPQEFNSEDEEEGVSGSDLEYSDNEPLPVVPQPRYGGPKSVDEDYLLADITNDEDWAIRRELDAAEALYNGSKLEQALSAFRALSSAHPRSPRSLYGVAKSLDALAEVKQSNAVLESAIDAYLSVLTQASKVPGALLIQAAQRCIDRGRFKGSYQRIIPAHQHLINKFPDDPKHRNDLAVTYLMMARNTRARAVLEEVLTRWPRDGMAHASLGFILKSEGQHEAAVSHLLSGIHTGEFAAAVQPQNQGKYYYVLGDALQRLGRSEEAYKVYSEAAVQGLFKSAYQRSVHNVDRLAAKPWWSLDETTYLPFFSKLERNWKKIRDEAQAILKMKDKSVGFQDEAETLVRSGDWKQFQLFVRGRKIEANCKRTPSTCRLISEFLPAASCSRGQAKLSVIHPGTHVWPHCGPTNCRLRAHLGLVVPGNTALRVANETRSWEEGRVLVFDDSFEHEVWHNGSSYRLILIVDVWHPELTAAERKTLKPI